MNLLVRDAISRIAVGPSRGRDISSIEAEQIIGGILDNQVDPVQAAVFLIALRMKGESIDEFSGLFKGMQLRVQQKKADVAKLFYLADPYNGYSRHYPCSPFLPAVLAALGLPTVMSGVESVGPKHGITAHKVLRLAGVDANQSVSEAVTSIESHGWAYLDQSQYLPGLSRLHKLRDKIVKRTAVTTLERVLQPIITSGETNLIIGYVHKAYPEIYSQIANQANYTSSLLIKGVEGGIVPALNKPIRRIYRRFNSNSRADPYEQSPEVPEHLLSRQATVPITDKDSEIERTVELGLDTLSGRQGVFRKSMVVSAAQIVEVYTPSLSFAEAVEKVEHCLDNGAALAKFQSLVKHT